MRIFPAMSSCLMLCVLTEAVSADASKDNTPCVVNSTVSTTTTTTTTPPPPPPKNAARMLALALAESAQQVSGHCQSQACDAPTPPSPLDIIGLYHTTVPLVQASTPERRSGRKSPPPAFTPDKPQLAPPVPTATQQSVDSTSMESAKKCTVPPVVQPETDSAPHSDTSLQKSVHVPNTTSQVPPTQKSPERHSSATVCDRAHTSSSDDTPATSCRDTQVSTQSAPDVSHTFEQSVFF